MQPNGSRRGYRNRETLLEYFSRSHGLSTGKTGFQQPNGDRCMPALGTPQNIPESGRDRTAIKTASHREMAEDFAGNSGLDAGNLHMISYPARDLWPERIYSLPELAYSDSLNACYELLDANLASGRDSAPAVHYGDRVITYGELAAEVMQIARALRKLGIRRGDSVILRLLNRPHFISTFLGVLRIGAIATPTPPLLRSREIRVIIDSADPILLISEADLWDEVEKIELKSLPLVKIEDLDGNSRYPECALTPQDT